MFLEEQREGAIAQKLFCRKPAIREGPEGSRKGMDGSPEEVWEGSSSKRAL